MSEAVSGARSEGSKACEQSTPRFSSRLIKGFGRCVLYVFTPGYYLMFLCCILPEIAALFKLGVIETTFIFVFQVFLLLNLIGNMILNIITHLESDITDSIAASEDLICQVCKNPSPEGHRYCPVCKTRLRKQHGYAWVYENVSLVTQQCKRYYTLYLAYAAICLLSGLVWTALYLVYKCGITEYDISNYDFSKVTSQHSVMASVFLLGSFLFIFFVLPLSYCRVTVMVLGLTMKDLSQGKRGTRNWKVNLEKALGKRWMLALCWPFTNSPHSDLKKI